MRERLCSVAGRTYDDLRQSLKEEMLETLRDNNVGTHQPGEKTR